MNELILTVAFVSIVYLMLSLMGRWKVTVVVVPIMMIMLVLWGAALMGLPRPVDIHILKETSIIASVVDEPNKRIFVWLAGEKPTSLELNWSPDTAAMLQTLTRQWREGKIRGVSVSRDEEKIRVEPIQHNLEMDKD